MSLIFPQPNDVEFEVEIQFLFMKFLSKMKNHVIILHLMFNRQIISNLREEKRIYKFKNLHNCK